MASLTAAVIDVFKSRNNNHNANQFFSTITGSKNYLDPITQIFAIRVHQIRRTACNKREAGTRFKNVLRTYATKQKKNGRWPSWYRDNEQDGEEHDETYPDEQPHPSTHEHDENWDDDICSVGPIGLLIESVLWNGMKIDAELKIWQKERAAHKHTGGPLPKPQNADIESIGKSKKQS